MNAKISLRSAKFCISTRTLTLFPRYWNSGQQIPAITVNPAVNLVQLRGLIKLNNSASEISSKEIRISLGFRASVKPRIKLSVEVVYNTFSFIDKSWYRRRDLCASPCQKRWAIRIAWRALLPLLHNAMTR